jgi:hypothetical protein
LGVTSRSRYALKFNSQPITTLSKAVDLPNRQIYRFNYIKMLLEKLPHLFLKNITILLDWGDICSHHRSLYCSNLYSQTIRSLNFTTELGDRELKDSIVPLVAGGELSQCRSASSEDLVLLSFGSDKQQ